MTKQDLIKKLAQTKKASLILGLSSARQRNSALQEIARILNQNQADILKANQKDAIKLSKSNPMLDRIILTKPRLAGISKDIKTVISLTDPLGRILEERQLLNGLKLKKITVPFGVIAVIYESRPNVTVDVVSLCLKSGNAVVLKGGADAWRSNHILVKLMQEAIKKASLSPDLILNIDPKDSYLIKHLLSAKDYIDLIIPRGGAGLIKFVQENTKIPMIETGAGVCHTYIDEFANIKMAVNIIYNAKTSRPSVCNALDTLILHQKIADRLLPVLGQKLAESQVEIFADPISHKILKQSKYPYLQKAKRTDFGCEFLSLKMAIKTVEDIDEALAHVRKYSTKHSEAIVTENRQNAQKFLSEVDAACVYHNVSTRFTDGSEFGMGGEIGISTQKLHARGPMSVKELTSYKWIIQGSGQVR
ncbi:MAG: glutamate-5-semialdehyde dehydrogenase [Candidatus Jacksonbacteria bacterium]